jgi:hypothetical protein
MKQYKNYTFNPQTKTATEVINLKENQGLEYVNTKYINESEAVVIFRVLTNDVVFSGNALDASTIRIVK